MSHDRPRYWAKPDVDPPLADQGFLYIAAEDPWSPVALGELFSFAQIAVHRCLILLGEPGMGKTSALVAEARAEHGAVLQVDLAATRSEEVLNARIFGSREFTTWAAGEGVLHVFLDSLDEAAIRLGVVADLLLEGLRGADISRLALRVACRTADRLLDFERQLAALWGQQHFGVFQLAPLTREDVRCAARDRGLDPDAFVRAVIERDIVPLGIKPITLGLLLDLAAEADSLPSSQLELYRRGMRKLVSEPAERRVRDPSTRGGLGIGARLAIAERVAGALLLSGRSAIATDETAEPSRDVVTLVQLEGGTERAREAAIPTPINVTGDGIREVLNSGLFAARAGGLGWAHQTYGEYLAARYLVGTEITPSRLLALSDDPDGRIVSQLRDVAGWTAALDAEFADYLLVHEPLVLLRGEIDFTDDRRAKLTRALLREEVAEELDRYDRRNRRNLAALAHPGFASTLRSRLANPAESQRVRELACELAALCELRELESDLAELAFNTREPVALRVDAVQALQALADDHTRCRLLPLARDPVPEDEDDDLKGAALAAVCPSVVSASEALAFLTPEKQSHRYGSYAAFLRRVPELLTQDELPAALDWVRRAPRHRGSVDHLTGVAELILVRAASAIEVPKIATAVAEAILVYLNDRIELQTFRTRDQFDVFRDPRKRRRIVEALVPLMLDGRLEPVAVVLSRPRLIDGDDLRWAAWHLRAVVGSDREAVWAELVHWASRLEGADNDLLAEFREMSPVLFELTRWQFGPIELGSELEAAMRLHHRHEEEAKQEQRRWSADLRDYDAAIDANLDAFEAGDLDAFWRLSLALWGEAGDLGSPDLTVSEGWQRATPARRARIEGAARVYLREYKPSDRWIEDTRRRYHPAFAACRALRYFADIGEPPGADALRKWLPGIVTFTAERDDQVAATSPLVLAATECPDDLAAAARRRFIAEAHGEGADRFLLSRLRAVMKGPVAAQLFELWKTEPLLPTARLELLKALLDAGVNEAAAEALRRLTPAAEGSAAIAAELVAHGGRQTWDHIWPLLKDQPAWGREVIQALASHWERRADVRTELSEPELAELFIWLSEQFPREEEPSGLGAHRVGPREEAGRYRDQIPNSIANLGTAAAIDAIAEIESATALDLSRLRLLAAETYRLRSWFPPRPQDVIRLAEAAQRRIVLSRADLRRVLVEALERIQEMLTAGQASQLWDTTAAQPKGEVEISAWIADRLRDKLDGRGIVINREVEIRVHPGGGLGERTDIHVDAIADTHVEGAKRVTVITEVKGCWHRQLRNAMQTQLAERYLSGSDADGIYLVVWFGPARWADGDEDRRKRCAQLNPQHLCTELEAQASALRRGGYHIVSGVLDASLHA